MMQYVCFLRITFNYLQSCMDGNDEMVSLLIEHGADVNSCDYEGWTPLIAASSLGHVDIAR